MSRVEKYLFCVHSDNIGQLLNDEVNALNAGLFQPRDLFLDDGLESHVRGEQTHSDT